MADVRLTATNPDDSSVVPVACDASGRLLLEEPQVVVGPPGPEGPPGPKGDDGKDGDPFSGNFADDVTFGSAVFAGDVGIGTSTATELLTVARGTDRVGADVQGTVSTLFIGNSNPDTSCSSISFDRGDGTLRFNNGVTGAITECFSIDSAGLAEFAGSVSLKGTSSHLYIDRDVAASDFANLIQAKTQGVEKFVINSDGTATFATNKAGFTKEGYLWCTTRRGDTVMLDFTSNGTGAWVEYTPTSRIDEIRDKLDTNRPDTGEMPADTP